MKKIHLVSSLAVASILALMTGCSGQDVEVTGEAKSAASIDGPISIEFFSVPSDSADEPESLAKLELDKLGAFKQTVNVEGDKIKIRAFADSDKNGACTEGEAWAEVEATVKEDGTVDPVTLDLTAAACPKADAEAK